MPSRCSMPPRLSHAAKGAFPGRGEQLAASWRVRQFEYTWIRAVARQPYIDFWHITQDALVYAAKAMSLDLSLSTRSELMTRGFP
jgi:2-haloacid dehalogenase